MEILTWQNFLLAGGALIIREIAPWLMKTVFPFYSQQVKEQKTMEARLKHDIEERELAFKKEIAEGRKQIEDRNAKAIESIDRNLTRLTELMTAISTQMASQSQILLALQTGQVQIQSAQNQFFIEGREAIKEIAALTQRSKE